ncbi:MAG: hypothetical protein MHPSP_002416 [Paramarteilia canceri]
MTNLPEEKRDSLEISTNELLRNYKRALKYFLVEKQEIFSTLSREASQYRIDDYKEKFKLNAIPINLNSCQEIDLEIDVKPSFTHVYHEKIRSNLSLNSTTSNPEFIPNSIHEYPNALRRFFKTYSDDLELHHPAPWCSEAIVKVIKDLLERNYTFKSIKVCFEEIFPASISQFNRYFCFKSFFTHFFNLPYPASISFDFYQKSS